MIRSLKVALVSVLSLSTSLALASPVSGQSHASGTLAEDERVIYNITLRGEESWSLIAHGYGNGDLDCYVFDQNDNLVSKDDDTTNICLVSGRPAWTGAFKVVLVNAGTSSIGYDVTVR